MNYVKTLNIPLENTEYDSLDKAKGDRTWHDFVMLLVNIKIKKNGEKGRIR